MDASHHQIIIKNGGTSGEEFHIMAHDKVVYYTKKIIFVNNLLNL